MIRELDETEFYKCEPLINDVGHLEVKAVIEGNNPGRIFVDHIDFPKTGLIWLGNNDGFFFIGDEKNECFNNDINEFIDKVVYPEAKKLGLKSFIAIGNHARWEKTIERIFSHRHIQVSHQNVYKLRSHYKVDNEPSVKNGYEALKVDECLYENEKNYLHNIEFLHSKILGFWSSSERFFRTGIGYCIVYQNKIVSLCFSGFVAENVHGIDIETIEEHQGNKLGQHAAHYVVKECVSNGMIPYWDCEEANKPSNQIAKNIGLENYSHYLVYIFPMDED
ncbi:GNAT family N-acetyltransferase [Guptibacillus hwajinpoensis]|uniref:Acetyltransferase n=1 Tax=Guptibacillus hwajinpoensis TaxID=208199 RepID=A0A0J6FUG8_9BACL|nr:GNAT family N-acetyltransferase [Alkalihalobacillus macyae]KMM38002.1 acetyltransferase [Alkalihalobacillus macyae]